MIQTFAGTMLALVSRLPVSQCIQVYGKDLETSSNESTPRQKDAVCDDGVDAENAEQLPRFEWRAASTPLAPWTSRALMAH